MLLKDRTAQLLEKNDDVNRWHNNLTSDSAKRIYSEALAKLEEFNDTTPNDLVNNFQNDKKKGEDMITDFIGVMREKYSPGVTRNILVGIKSWLRHNDIIVLRKINTGNRFETPTIVNERPPSQKEMGWIIGYANPRAKAAISLIAFAGLRPNAAANITIANMPDLNIDGIPHFIKTPALITIPPNLSKNKRPYITFLSSEGCKYLEHYFKARFESGEKLTSSSPILTASSKARIKTFSRKGFQRLVKRVFEEAKFNNRPYVLRSYYATAIDNSRLPHNWAEFWLGHTGDISMTYTVRKRLSDSVLEDMREQFKKNVDPLLSSSGGEVTREELAERDKELSDLNKKIEELEWYKKTFGQVLLPKYIEAVEKKYGYDIVKESFTIKDKK